MTYMEAWKMMAPQLRPVTNEQIEAYLLLFGMVKTMCEREERQKKEQHEK